MTFTREEFLSRIAGTKERMERRGIDVLLVSDPANMNYLTGYDGWSFYVPQCVVVALEAEEPIWIGRKMDAHAARVTTFLSRENVLGYTDDYVQAVAKHPFDFVADVVAEHGWAERVVGVEMDAYYFTATCFDALVRSSPTPASRTPTCWSTGCAR